MSSNGLLSAVSAENILLIHVRTQGGQPKNLNLLRRLLILRDLGDELMVVSRSNN